MKRKTDEREKDKQREMEEREKDRQREIEERDKQREIEERDKQRELEERERAAQREHEIQLERIEDESTVPVEEAVAEEAKTPKLKTLRMGQWSWIVTLPNLRDLQGMNVEEERMGEKVECVIDRESIGCVFKVERRGRCRL